MGNHHRWNFFVSADDEGLTTSEPLIEEVKENVDNEKTLVEKFMENSDLIQFNVGGEMMLTSRASILHIADSHLGQILLNQSSNELSIDNEGYVFLDFNPNLFRHLLEQLRSFEAGESIVFYPPTTVTLMRPFRLMLDKLTLTPSLISKEEIVAIQRTTLNIIPDSTLSSLLVTQSDAEETTGVDSPSTEAGRAVLNGTLTNFDLQSESS